MSRKMIPITIVKKQYFNITIVLYNALIYRFQERIFLFVKLMNCCVTNFCHAKPILYKIINKYLYI